ncbi:TPA: helix-turn-helix transcriptional regulator [Morganella morganii]|nr:helix-turn-helix transcriptional regulator [Morganella morganii]
MDKIECFNMYIGYRIKELRSMYDISKIQMSEKTDVSIQDILMYESGLKSIPVHVFFRIAQLFNISINDLLSDCYTKLKEDNGFIGRPQ